MSSAATAILSSSNVKDYVKILIREDLKSQKVFNHLRALGLEDQLHLNELAGELLFRLIEKKKSWLLHFALGRCYHRPTRLRKKPGW